MSVSHSAARLGYTLLPGNLLEVCPSVTQLQGSDTHYYRETYCVCVHQSLSCKARIHTITGKPTGSVSVSHSAARKPTGSVSISHSAARLGYTLLSGNLLEVCPLVTQLLGYTLLPGNLLCVCPSVTQLLGYTRWKPTGSVSISHSAARLGYTLLPGNLLCVCPSVTQLQGSDTHYYRETYWKCVRQSLSCKETYWKCVHQSLSCKARIHTIIGKPTGSVSISHSAARIHTITGKPTVCVSISHSAARLGYTLLPGNLLEVCPSVTQLQGNLLEVCPSVTQLQGSDTHYYRETYWKCVHQSLSCKARIHTIIGKPTGSVSISHSAARLGYTLLSGNLLEVCPSVTQLQGSDTHYYRETYWKCVH